MAKLLLLKITASLLLLSLASEEATGFFTKTEMLTVITEKKQAEKPEDNKATNEEGKENDYLPLHYFHLVMSVPLGQFPIHHISFNSTSYRFLPENPPEVL